MSIWTYQAIRSKNMDPSEVRGMRAILASEPKAIFHVIHYGNQVIFTNLLIST
jgi:hypothetical protein